MKRRRNSTRKGNKEGDKYDYSFADLPRPIIDDILLKLSVRSILVCKCVCKTWRSIISDPQFAKLQYAQAEPCALLRTLDSIYLVEPKDCHNFNLGYCTCHNHSCFRCDRHMEVDTKLKIPMHHAQMVLVGDAQMDCRDQNFKIVNSCNGFLCLSEPSTNEPVVVCNPITGEYIDLPVGKRRPSKKTQYFVECGFGFSPGTNQYKVIRMFERWIGDPRSFYTSISTPATGRINYSRGVEIYTLGARSWKSIDDAPFVFNKIRFPTYLEGCVHWLICGSARRQSMHIVSFSFDNEKLQMFPSLPNGLNTKHNVSMGVLEGCLCICDASSYDPINIWVMKKYGVQESWTKMFSIDNQPDRRWPYGIYQPINYLKNGAVLMFHLKCALICCDPERLKLKYLTIHGVKSKFEAIAYVPSFISLKEAIVGDDVVVLNISSRFARFKVQGKTKPLSLAEEDREMELYSDCWSSDNEWKDEEGLFCIWWKECGIQID